MIPALVRFGYGAECGGADNQDCVRDALASFKPNYDAIINELLSLQGTGDTLILTMDYYFPRVKDFQDREVYQEIKPLWDAFNEHIAATGSARGIAVAPGVQWAGWR